MEVKSLDDCLNNNKFGMNGCIIDSLDLENIRKYLLEKENGFNEGGLGLSKVLQQLNSSIKNHDQFVEMNKKLEFCELMRLKLDWLIKRNTEPEDDDRQHLYNFLEN